LFLEYTVDIYRQGGETYESNLVISLLIIGNMHKIVEESEEAERVWTDAYEISKKMGLRSNPKILQVLTHLLHI
jgi:hypothetical protein